MRRRRTIVIGHRGSRGLQPENSLTAFAEALRQGAGGLEMDLFITKDGQVVVTHDATISHQLCVRPGGASIGEQESERLKIHQLKLEEIRPYDCGSKPNPLFPEQENTETHIPLLGDVLEAACRFARGEEPLQFLLEIKSEPATDNIYHPEPHYFVKRVLEVVAEKNMEQQVSIISFDKRSLKEARKQNSNIRPGMPLTDGSQLQAGLDELGFMPDLICPLYTELDEHLLNFAHKHGIALIPWTVNEEEALRKMIELEVDGIITDFPDRAVSLIEEYK